uniref:RBBP8 N-terminal-like protein n=1 Tax=Panthera tigris altaica TaxID=74533 RepID=A0A8C9JH25_PANTA
MESFMESLNRLKDVHENEVRGLQNRLLELNSERLASNHALTQQALTGHLWAARPRAECWSHSWQTGQGGGLPWSNELNRLQGENETLKEEIKRLRGPRLKPQYREGASDPPSPLLLPSPGARKAAIEKTSGGHEEAEDDHPGGSPQRGEKSTGDRTLPVARISPSASLPETWAPDTSPQRISNQLHGTIAVVRPGSQACSADRGSTNGTPALPLTGSSPPSPPNEHSLPLDSARLRGPPPPGGTPPSPPVSSDSEGPQGEAALSGGGHTQPTGPGSPRGKEATATQDYVPDKPLDLSERGRGRDAPKPPDQPGSLSPPAAHTPSPEPPHGAEAPAQPVPWGLSNGTKGARAPEAEGPPSPADPSQALPGPHPNVPSPSGTGDEARGRPKPPPHPHRPDADGHPELSKAQVQWLESDDLDESDTSDDEVGQSCEVGAKPSTPREGPRCFCTKERGQSLQQKRKRAAGPWCRASKKPPPGRRNPGEPLTAHEGSGSPRDPEDGSPPPSNGSWEET